MSLIPRWYNRFPAWRRGASNSRNLSRFLDEWEEEFANSHTGLSVFSDDKNIYVEADVPGLTAKEVEVSIDNEGLLWIKGEKKEEDKGKKYYRKTQQSFSYCIPLWDEIDINTEPSAICKDGVMRITFAKKNEKQKEAKKIQVKEDK